MTRQPNVDQIVTRWVDDGPEVAPERFVWAALDQVERTPQRGSWSLALENTPMLLKFAVPVLGAAAVILVAIFAFGRINPEPAGTPAESPAAVVSPSSTPDPCARDVAEVPAPGTLDVMWCIPRGTDRIVLPFTIQAPESWIDQVYTGGETLYFRPTGEPAIVFAVTGPDTIDEWVAELEGKGVFNLGQREEFEISGGEATVFNVLPAPGVDDVQAPPVIESSDVPLYLTRGDTVRVWILEGSGEAVAVATSTDQGDLPAWAEQVDAAVRSLEWGTPP
jgi:hypothetical protein